MLRRGDGGGACRSPISSSSEDDNGGARRSSFSASEPEGELDNTAAPVATSKRRSTAPTTVSRAPRKLKRALKAMPAAAPAKKLRASSTRNGGSSRKAMSIPAVQKRTAPLPAVRSTKELIASADDKLVYFLIEQLAERNQAQLGATFGFGQGYLVQPPPKTAWKRIKDRARLASWLEALGFTLVVLAHRSLFRIASLRADIILRELHQRTGDSSTADVDGHDDTIDDMPHALVTTTASAVDNSNDNDDTTDALVSTDALAHETSLEAMRSHFRELDAQTLEIVSLSTHDRRLSSEQHTAVADAIERALAQPSVRKEKSRARRLSRLRGIAGRVAPLTLAPLATSTVLPSLVEDDGDDDNDEEENEDENDGADVAAARALHLRGDAVARQSLASALSKRSLSTARVSRSHRDSSLEPRVLKQHQRRQQHQRQLVLDNVLRLVLHARVLSVTTLRSVLRHVSPSWRRISTVAYAWAMGDATKYVLSLMTLSQPLKSMADVYADYPRGHYFSSGAYKQVHKVYSTRHKRLEAVSVMDINAIARTGNENVVRQEIAYTILLSELVEIAFCPNFVQIFGLFVAPDGPRADRWGSVAHRRPTDLLTDRRLSVDPASLAAMRASTGTNASNSSNSGLYQYIQMEFCDGGDLEDFISLQREKQLPVVSVVVPFFFQMVFSIYVARERFDFRHCDIKLLNFFLKEIAPAVPSTVTMQNTNSDRVVQYVLEDVVFELRLPAPFAYWIKLADYGTAESNVETLGQRVALGQFTTLENTPIEFLLEGDAALQSFAADTFSLGLALLHLFTGSAPYEMILENARCPDELANDLKRIWTNPRTTSGFSVLRRVVKDDKDNVLVHTLYRYVVLFGLPNDPPSAATSNKVWTALLKHLRPASATASAPFASPRRSRSATAMARAAKSATSPVNRFVHDCALFSLANGSDPTIARGRARLAQVPGAAALLAQLVQFDPLERPSMLRVLRDPLFASLQVPRTSSSQQQQQQQRVGRAEYVVDAYRRSGSNTAITRDSVALPDV